jgi:hypothetical protein
VVERLEARPVLRDLEGLHDVDALLELGQSPIPGLRRSRRKGSSS